MILHDLPAVPAFGNLPTPDGVDVVGIDLPVGRLTTAALRATGVPVLVAHGIRDTAWPIPWQRDMAARLGARYEVVPGAEHSPQVENPTATADLLDDFLGTH